nr:pentatricopeptide repeat-containing protein, mitochondrial [Quercus suber]
MLIRKFCRWRQLDNVFKLWSEMIQNGVDPDRSSYIVLIHGLFLNGKLEEAHKYYIEMKEKHLIPEPKTDEMLQAWLSRDLIKQEIFDANLKLEELSESGAFLYGSNRISGLDWVPVNLQHQVAHGLHTGPLLSFNPKRLEIVWIWRSGEVRGRLEKEEAKENLGSDNGKAQPSCWSFEG